MNWKALGKAVGSLLLSLLGVGVAAFVLTIIVLHFTPTVAFSILVICVSVFLGGCLAMSVKILYDHFNRQ
jgi:Na+(H+)/acetate symporter ActP